jgi:23S rRNA pseudouridine1911/1915/1917 synthase
MLKKLTIKKTDLVDKTSLRLDHFLVAKFPQFTRNYLQQVIKGGNVLVNDAKVRASKKVKTGDRLAINFPKPEKIDLKPEAIPLNVIFEDKNLLVINKPAGLVVHPGAGNHQGTLVNAILHHSPRLKRIGAKLRPGIVHRLDRDTSGVLVVAKNDSTFQELASQFKNHLVKKEYLALVYGKVKPKEGKIIAPIRRDYHNRKRMAISVKGKEAETDYKVAKYFGNQFTLVRVFPKTGRTHQIRVHLNSIGYPIVGDKVYRPKQNFVDQAGKLGLTRQFLHAEKISFRLNSKRLEFKAPLPPELKSVLTKLT